MITTAVPDTAIGQRFAGLSTDRKMCVIESGLRILDTEQTCGERLGQEQWVAKLAEAETAHLDATEVLKSDFLSRTQRLETHIAELESLKRAAIEQAVAEEATRRKDAERKCSEQAEKILELSGSVFDRVKVETTAVRAEYELRLAELTKREQEARDTLASMVVRKQKSTTKGVDGEATVAEMLHRLFPTAEVEDSSSRPGLGDFVLLQGDVCMMVEAKNYTRNVAKAEVEKFMRDMEANPQYTCGILASLESGVSGYEDFALLSASGRPVVFLHNVSNEPHKLQYAFSVFGMVHSIENLDLGKQSVVEAVNREIADKNRRLKGLRSMSEKYVNELEAWIATDHKRSFEVLNLIARDNRSTGNL